MTIISYAAIFVTDVRLSIIQNITTAIGLLINIVMTVGETLIGLLVGAAVVVGERAIRLSGVGNSTGLIDVVIATVLSLGRYTSCTRLEVIL